MKKEVIFLIFVFLIGFVFAENLKVTEEHPFYIDNGWKEAKNLEQGDIFLLEDGRKVFGSKLKIGLNIGIMRPEEQRANSLSPVMSFE